MILDTSALLAILLREPEAERFAAAIESADTVRMSAASHVEAAMYVDRNGDEVRRAMLDTFVKDFAIQLEPVTCRAGVSGSPGLRLVREGQAQGGLNFGDCFSYALSKGFSEPLLFKGGDSGHTDLR